MSLDNLLKIKQLQVHKPSKEAMLRLLDAAKRNIADAHILAVSGENRFDAAYKCIMQCAMLALWLKGYRTSTSQPGHHHTAIQTLTLTIGLAQSTVIVLDALRKQRNVRKRTNANAISNDSRHDRAGIGGVSSGACAQ